MTQEGTEKPSAVTYLRIIGVAAVIGIPAAFVAALFLAVVHWTQHWLWTDLPSDLGGSRPQWYLVLGLPILGAVVVLIARRFFPGDGGHRPLLGLASTPTPPKNGLSVALAAIGTLGFGAVLGPEGPLIALGSVVGMTATMFVRLQPKEQAVLGTAGSFSAISALFGGPLVAGMLLVESGIGMGAALIPALLPGLVAAAIGYVIFVGLGNWGGIHEAGLTVADLPLYHDVHIVDLLIAVAVGVMAAILLTLIRAIGNRVEVLRGGPRLSAPVLISGGLAVGVLALIARGLGANSQDVLFSGQSSVPALVQQTSAKIVLVLLVAKGIAYAISLGCGFRGGPIFPAIFLGVALTTLCQIAFNTSPTLAVSVGAAAGMGAMTRLLFAPVLFAMLLVGDAGVNTVSAAVLASVATWLTMTALEQRAAKAHPDSAAPAAPAG